MCEIITNVNCSAHGTAADSKAPMIETPCEKGNLEVRVDELEKNFLKLTDMYIQLSNYIINVERRIR